jgi:hypothetical protein
MKTGQPSDSTLDEATSIAAFTRRSKVYLSAAGGIVTNAQSRLWALLTRPLSNNLAWCR